MARRTTGQMNGERYMANTNKEEIHDLDNEQTNCQIDVIIAASHDQPYAYLKAALDDGYDPCAWCLEVSAR